MTVWRKNKALHPSLLIGEEEYVFSPPIKKINEFIPSLKKVSLCYSLGHTSITSLLLVNCTYIYEAHVRDKCIEIKFNFKIEHFNYLWLRMLPRWGQSHSFTDLAGFYFIEFFFFSPHFSFQSHSMTANRTSEERKKAATHENCFFFFFTRV